MSSEQQQTQDLTQHRALANPRRSRASVAPSGRPSASGAERGREDAAGSRPASASQ